MMKRVLKSCMQWLWILFFVPIQVGCQFLGPLPSETPVNNTPPMIWIADIKEPTLEAKYIIDKTQQPDGITRFKVPSAFDPDFKDAMHGYWLLDHDTSPKTSYLGRATETLPTQGFDPFQKRAINFTLDLVHNNSRLKVGKISTLVFYITDKEVNPRIFLDATSGTSGKIKWPEGVGYDRIAWTLQVE